MENTAACLTKVHAAGRNVKILKYARGLMKEQEAFFDQTSYKFGISRGFIEHKKLNSLAQMIIGRYDAILTDGTHAQNASGFHSPASTYPRV